MVKNTVKLTSMIAAIYLFAGYQELSAQTKDSLKEKQIEEVVMIGYGTAKKRDLTGSIAKVGGDVVADKPNANPINAFCFDNAVVDEDRLENKKPIKRSAAKKIDGVITALMTMGEFNNYVRH